MTSTLRPPTLTQLESSAVQDLVMKSTTAGTIGPRAAVRGLVAQWSRRVAALACLLLLATYRWWIALGLLVASIWQLRHDRRHYQALVAMFRNRAQPLRRADYLRDLALTPPAAKEIRLFGLERWIVDRFRAAFLGAMNPVWHDRRRKWRRMGWGALPTVAAEFLALGVLGRAATRGEIGVGALFVYVQALLGSLALAEVDDNDLYVEEGLAVVDAALTLERATGPDPTAVAGRCPPASLPAREICFESVTFGYPGRTESVFEDLSLSVPVGCSLAIVGENGAGKTTLIKLLAGLYHPTAGRVTVDGVDLTAIDTAAWQRRIAAIFQDYVRYPLSVADNIAFGAIEHLDDQARLEEAAAQAGILDVVRELPDGWRTIASREFEGGVELSGGQWQRLALARALFAATCGAQILVLDEPTAHLDVRAEADFYARFLDLTRGRTAILVSHRFSTVRLADRIVLLEAGHVAEAGTHDQLVALGGRYAELFELQASRYAAKSSA